MPCPPGEYSRCCCVRTSAPWLGCGPSPQSAQKRCWAAGAPRSPPLRPAVPSPPPGNPWSEGGFLWNRQPTQWPGHPRVPGHWGAVPGDSSSHCQVCQGPGSPGSTAHLPTTAPRLLPASLHLCRCLAGAVALVRAGAPVWRLSVQSPAPPATGLPLPAAKEEAAPSAKPGPKSPQARLSCSK